MNIVLDLAVLLVLGSSGSDTPSSIPRTNRFSVEWVITRALTNHASLRASQLNLEAARERVAQIRRSGDVRLGIDLERVDQTALKSVSSSESSVAQSWSVGGRIPAMRRAAIAETQIAEQALRRSEFEVRLRCRRSFVRFATSQAHLELVGKIEKVFDELVRVSRTRFESGRGNLSDVLHAEIALVKLRERRAEVEGQIALAQSELNVLMNQSPDTVLGVPEPLVFRPVLLSRYAVQPRVHSGDDDREIFDWAFFELTAQEQAAALRPELVAAKLRRDSRVASEEAARQERIPEMEFRLEGRWDQDLGEVTGYDTGIRTRVAPMNRLKYRALEQQAASLRTAAELDLARLERETQKLVYDQVKRMATRQFHYLAWRDRIVPLVREAVVAAQTAYLTGQGTLLEWLVAVQRLVEEEWSLQEHLADYDLAKAEFEWLTGAIPE